MSQNKYGEPWKVTEPCTNSIDIVDVDGNVMCALNNDEGDTTPEMRERAMHIVAYVNACAGIDDPAKLRRQRDEQGKAWPERIVPLMALCPPSCEYRNRVNEERRQVIGQRDVLLDYVRACPCTCHERVTAHGMPEVEKVTCPRCKAIAECEKETT